MNRFFVFFVGAVGVFLFALSQIYGNDVTPAVRNTLMVGGVVLFVGVWVFQIVGQVFGFINAAKEVKGAFAKAKKTLKNNPALAAQARRVATQSPLKNFLLSLLFVLVAGAFLAFGILVKQGYSPFGRGILLAISSVFIVIGLATTVHHFRNMMRRK